MDIDTTEPHRLAVLVGSVDGEPRDAAEVDAAADVVLDELGWWARTLRAMRTQRSATPTGAAVV